MTLLLYFQQLLNNCFDDIEKFVSRLQQAAEAYKELERRRVERGGKGSRNLPEVCMIVTCHLYDQWNFLSVLCALMVLRF